MKSIPIWLAVVAILAAVGVGCRKEEASSRPSRAGTLPNAGAVTNGLPPIAPTTLPRPQLVLRSRQEGDPEILEKFGVEVVGLKLASGGYTMNFRYRVADPEKAKPLLDRGIKPYVIHDKSQAKLMTYSAPKTGPLRSTTVKPEAGKVYSVLFANPGRLARPGDTVQVVIGPFLSREMVLGPPASGPAATGPSRPVVTSSPLSR